MGAHILDMEGYGHILDMHIQDMAAISGDMGPISWIWRDMAISWIYISRICNIFPTLDIKVTSHNVPVIVDKASTSCPSTAPWCPALLRTFPVLAIASGMRIRLWLFLDTSLRSPASSTCVTLSDTLFSWSQKQTVTSICNHLDNSRHVGSQLCSFVPILSLHSGVPCVLVLAHGQPLW